MLTGVFLCKCQSASSKSGDVMHMDSSFPEGSNQAIAMAVANVPITGATSPPPPPFQGASVFQSRVLC